MEMNDLQPTNAIELRHQRGLWLAEIYVRDPGSPFRLVRERAIVDDRVSSGGDEHDRVTRALFILSEELRDPDAVARVVRFDVTLFRDGRVRAEGPGVGAVYREEPDGTLERTLELGCPEILLVNCAHVRLPNEPARERAGHVVVRVGTQASIRCRVDEPGVSSIE